MILSLVIVANLAQPRALHKDKQLLIHTFNTKTYQRAIRILLFRANQNQPRWANKDNMQVFNYRCGYYSKDNHTHLEMHKVTKGYIKVTLT